MPTPITSKKEMYRRLNAGLLGHTLPAVETDADLAALIAGAGDAGRFAIRLKRPGGRTRFHLTVAETLAAVALIPAGEWNVTPMIDDSVRVCYGHLLDGPGGWWLHYSDTPKPCKLLPSQDGCVERHRVGLSARVYLRTIMDDIAWETLERLVDDYPGHVIEFSVLADRRSACGPTNTIFWEVRCTTGEYERNSGWAGK